MSQSSDAQDVVKNTWDASGRTVDVEQAQGHAPEQVTAIQLALVSMGYNLMRGQTQDASDSEGDGVDGLLGDGTSQAIKHFQDDTGFEPTGALDDETEDAILRAYGEALVASGHGAMFEDGLDSVHMTEPQPTTDAGLQAHASDSIEDLAPGELPDEPVIDFLDDAEATKVL